MFWGQVGTLILRGEGWTALRLIIEEHFDSGEQLELLLGFPEGTTYTELLRVPDIAFDHPLIILHGQGDAPWPVTLRLEFVRPQKGTAAWVDILRQNLEQANLLGWRVRGLTIL